MTKRKSIGPKVRFEVFKRDNFKCQYCGQTAPDVVLHIDHIIPVKDGGTNDITNLITACSDCNLGKGARKLDDNAVVEKQRCQLEELNERREQLKMMAKWREELLKLEDQQLSIAVKRINDLMKCWSLNQTGENNVRKCIKKFGLQQVLDAIERSASQYIEYDDKGEPTDQSTSKFVDYIPKICNGIRLQEQHPEIRDLSYICGIARNRFSYYDKRRAWKLVKDCYESGLDIEVMKDIAKTARNWSEFCYSLEEYLE